MTATLGLGPWLRQQREQRSWTRNELARRLIRVALVSGDTAMPAAADVAANIYRWERGTVTPSDRYRLYYCHSLGIPSDRFGDPAYEPDQDVPRVIITISLPEGTDTQLRLTSIETPAGPGTGTLVRTPRNAASEPVVPCPPGLTGSSLPPAAVVMTAS
jgi:transcriptional regulator with XRE-family HTH domain